MRHARDLVACISAVVLLPGCSPYIYKQEAAKFDEGVTQAVAMFEAQREFMKNTASNINRADLATGGYPRIVLTERCSEIVVCLNTLAFRASAACASTFLNGDKGVTTGASKSSEEAVYTRLLNLAAGSCQVQTATGASIDIPVQAAAQRQVLIVLSDYASALAGIVNAADREALSESATKACGATQQLLVTTAGLSASVDSAADAAQKKQEAERKARIDAEANAVSTVCGLISQVGIAVLDYQRVKVLTQVVNDADPVVRTLATYLQHESRKISTILVGQSFASLTDTLGDTIGGSATTERAYFAAVDGAVLARGKFVAFLEDSPENVFVRMANAHSSLKDAVNDPKTRLSTAITSLQEFQRSAKQAYDAVKALSAPASKN